MFSVQIDIMQDVATTDQCAVVLRYVTDTVHEMFIGVVSCESSTGGNFVQLLQETLVNIDIRKCVGKLTDGAANMQGLYKGFSTLLSSASPNQVHIWCCDRKCIPFLHSEWRCRIYQGLIYSYKHMNMWQKVSDDRCHSRLSPIGDTRG